MMMQLSRLAAAVGFLVTAALLTPAQAQTWGSGGVAVHQLPSGFTLNDMGRINVHGQVVGQFNGTAAVFNPGGAVQNLGITDLSMALGLNDVGDVVGYLHTGGAQRGFIHSGGQVQVLGTLPGMTGSVAIDINNAGQVIGSSSGSGTRAFLYDQGTMTDMGTLGGTVVYAQDINEAGVALGRSFMPMNNGYHAFLYEAGVMEDLGGFTGYTSHGFSLNDAGQVAGMMSGPNGSMRAFLYGAGVLHDISTVGEFSSTAMGLSEDGVVAGYIMADQYTERAALWEHDGSGYQAYMLTDIMQAAIAGSDWLFYRAGALSADGRYLLAQGRSLENQYHGWVILEQLPATAVPEPATLLLLATGLVSLAVLRRRASRPTAS